MKVLCYSSFTFSYLNRARVLFQTLRRFHPDWELVALITDAAPESFAFDPAGEPFDRVVWAQDLGIPNFDSWLFKHDVVEVCTAVKGPFIHQACGQAGVGGADAVIYLDPDTALFSSLAPLEAMLEEHRNAKRLEQYNAELARVKLEHADTEIDEDLFLVGMHHEDEEPGEAYGEGPLGLLYGITTGGTLRAPSTSSVTR